MYLPSTSLKDIFSIFQLLMLEGQLPLDGANSRLESSQVNKTISRQPLYVAPHKQSIAEHREKLMGMLMSICGTQSISY